MLAYHYYIYESINNRYYWTRWYFFSQKTLKFTRINKHLWCIKKYEYTRFLEGFEYQRIWLRNQNIRLLNIDNNSVQVENFLNDIFPHIVFKLSVPISVYE